MKTDELMIGNYLRYPNTKPFKVDQEDFISKNFWNDFFEGIIEPIPLTKEWFPKLNIELRNKRNSHRGEYYTFNLCGVSFYFFSDRSVIERVGYHVEKKYVHQLQNLHNALK